MLLLNLDFETLKLNLNNRWVLAVDMYEKIAKTIAPKREALQKAESDYQAKLKKKHLFLFVYQAKFHSICILVAFFVFM